MRSWPHVLLPWWGEGGSSVILVTAESLVVGINYWRGRGFRAALKTEERTKGRGGARTQRRRTEKSRNRN